MPGRVFANLGHPIGHVPLEQSALDQFLGVGIYGNVAAQTIEPSDAVDEPPHVLDRPIGQRAQCLDHFGVGTLGESHMERNLFTIEHVDEGVAVAIGFAARRGRKTLPDAIRDVEDVFAGAQRVGAKIGAGAVRLPALLAAQRHPVRLAR